MKKVYLFIVLVLVVAIGIFAAFAIKNKTKDKDTAKTEQNSNDNGTVAGASTIKSTPNSDVILYVGDGCPHCKKVEDNIKANKIDEKVPFELKEVWYNKDNANDLNKTAEVCKISQDLLGVPLLFDKPSSKCYVGEEEITNFFNSKLNQSN